MREPLTDPKMLRFSKAFAPGVREVPVSWLREHGAGRLFYTNLGHREETYANPSIMKHLLDGIQYALGDLEADATPTAKTGEKPALAPAK